MSNDESNDNEQKNFYQKSLTNIISELSELINKKMQWECCKDDYIEDAKYLKISDKNVNFVKLSEETCNSIKKIALVLESPHIKEFDEGGKGIKPAQGHTGYSLKENLPDLIKQIGLPKELHGVYKMQIINAIQYQTSLGLNTEIFRDRIWLNCWLRGGRDNFFTRIKEYQPDIIINLCTKGSHEDDLIVNFKQIKAKTVINEKYIGTINDSLETKLTFGKDKSIINGNSIVYTSTWLDEKNYTLNGFVQTSLDEYKNLQSNVVLIKGIHPASKKFSESKLLVLE